MFNQPIIKKLTAIALVGICASFSSITYAGDQEKHIGVMINKTNDNNAKVEIDVDGNLTSFLLPKLSDGESRTITLDNGNTLNLTKNNGVVIVNIGGEEIKIPDEPNDLVARIKTKVNDLSPHKDTIHVVAPGLTKNQMQIIRDAILSAGVTKPVTFTTNGNVFIKAISIDGEHDIDIDSDNIHVIKKSIHIDSDKAHEWHDKDGTKTIIIEKEIIKEDDN